MLIKGSRETKHTISYHVQSSLTFELDIKINGCHGLLTRYTCVPIYDGQLFPSTMRFVKAKSFEISKNPLLEV